MRKNNEYIILFADKSRATFCCNRKDLRRKTEALEILNIAYTIYRPSEIAFENFMTNMIKLQENEQ